MRARSPHTADVLRPLPARVARELDTAEVDALVDALVRAGWRTGQLGARAGSAPALGSPQGDADSVRAVLRSLLGQVAPDVAHARAERARRRAGEGASVEVRPATPEVRERALAEIRARLKGVPSRRTPPPPRARPCCCLCDGEGSFFVTREVHLCRRCVAVLASGEARLSVTA